MRSFAGGRVRSRPAPEARRRSVRQAYTPAITSPRRTRRKRSITFRPAALLCRLSPEQPATPQRHGQRNPKTTKPRPARAGARPQMNLHEYQAKLLLSEYGIPVPPGKPAHSVKEALRAADELPGEGWVVKAQVHAG